MCRLFVHANHVARVTHKPTHRSPSFIGGQDLLKVSLELHRVGSCGEREPITGVWGRSPQQSPGCRAPGGGHDEGKAPEYFACPKVATSMSR